MWSDWRGKFTLTGYSVNDSTFLKSYHSVGNAELNIPHYSLVARSEALRRYFLEHCSWESAAPSIKDPDRIPAPSTLRRWFCRLDSSRSAFFFLRPTMEVVGQLLARGEQLDCGSLRLSWPTLFPFLQVFWPLRL